MTTPRILPGKRRTAGRLTSRRRALTALAGCALLLGVGSLTACRPTVTVDGVAQTSAVATADLPHATPDTRLLGVVALGNSGVTGYATSDSDAVARANSWVTGSNPDVHSIYQRLLAARPETGDRVANDGIPGGTAAMLQMAVVDAIEHVPHPQLAVVEILGNDIACDGTDAANLTRFGTLVRNGLDTITGMSPGTQILVVSQLGSPAAKAAAIATDPAARAHASGTGACSLFNPAGVIQPANITRLAGLTDQYQQELQAVCAEVSLCHFDDGAMAGYQYQLSDLVVGDWDHLTIAGQAKVAALLWPQVTKLLGLK